jgi:ribosomal protein L25 (general stress protein Ctc)
LEIIADVSIPDDELVFADIYASGKMKIDISLKACIFWNLLCTTLYTDNMEYNVDFQKEGDDWKIISMIEM